MAKLVEGQEKGSRYTIAVRSHLEHGDSPWYPDHVFAISGGGANSCILGQHDKVLDFEDTGELMVFTYTLWMMAMRTDMTSSLSQVQDSGFSTFSGTGELHYPLMRTSSIPPVTFMGTLQMYVMTLPLPHIQHTAQNGGRISL